MAQSNSPSLAEKFRQYLLGSQGSKLDAIVETLEQMAKDHFDGLKSYSEQIRIQAAQDEPDFYGAGINTASDVKRVKGGLRKIYMHVRDGERHTLAEISNATGVPEASVSAGLRSLRREKYGEHIVLRHHVGNGLHTYRFIANQNTVADLEAHLKVNGSVAVHSEPVLCPCGVAADTDFNGMKMCYPCLDKTI